MCAQNTISTVLPSSSKPTLSDETYQTSTRYFSDYLKNSKKAHKLNLKKLFELNLRNIRILVYFKNPIEI